MKKKKSKKNDDLGYDIHIGEVGYKVNWRDYDPPEVDDEDLPCPEDVKLILGFDPDDESPGKLKK